MNELISEFNVPNFNYDHKCPLIQGLCKEGEGGRFVDHGDNTYGGKYVVNPSGGLISKGHPLGATGLAQCAELNWQVVLQLC